VDIRAQSPAGLFHGVQTLRQLLPTAVERRSAQPGPWVVPGGRIVDYPRFGYRGVMLDVARHFFPVATVKRYIDQMALYKVNYFHLHLTDDQGWRIMIDSWPRLATYGGSTQVGGGPGGYYTKAQYQEIVAYAADRHITVVPEVDMPGHTNAALASYAELNCNGDAPPLYTGTSVGFSSLCVSKEITYRFVEDVIREIAALTPGPYFHIGGDETNNSDADYRAFMNRVQPLVAKYGKKTMGWHEFAKTTTDTSAVPQYWGRGTSNEDVKAAASRGNKVLMSPAEKAYMDLQYTPSTPLGLSWAGRIEVRDAYDWNPGAYLSGVAESSVLGVEAPLWGETTVTQTDLDYMTFPRLPAYAELGWSPWSTHDWESFRVRLAAQGPRWTNLGIGFYRSPQVSWPPSTDPVTLVNQKSGRCVSPQVKPGELTRIVISDCDSGRADQYWRLTQDGELRVTIDGVTKCLDAAGGKIKDGTDVIAWDCHGGPNQKWTVNSESQIGVQQSSMCLDVWQEKIDNGSPIKLYTCRSTGIGNQVFIRA
jgi:hexosaminidase